MLLGAIGVIGDLGVIWGQSLGVSGVGASDPHISNPCSVALTDFPTAKPRPSFSGLASSQGSIAVYNLEGFM